MRREGERVYMKSPTVVQTWRGGVQTLSCTGASNVIQRRMWRHETGDGRVYTDSTGQRRY